MVSGLGKEKPPDTEEDKDQYEKTTLVVYNLLTKASALTLPENQSYSLDLKQYVEALYKECGTHAMFGQASAAVHEWAGLAPQHG